MLVPTVAPLPEDVSSIEGIVAAFYKAVHVAPHEPRLWGRDRTLYHPDVRFIAIDGAGVNTYTHQQLVDETEPMVQAGFYEREAQRKVFRFGNIAHVLSSYETRTTPDGPVMARGLNSLQLYFDGKRWWIANVTWQSETKDLKLPAEFVSTPAGK